MADLAGAVLARIYREYIREAIEVVRENRIEKEKARLRRKVVSGILGRDMQEALRESVRVAKSIVEEVRSAYARIGYRTVTIDFALKSRGLVGTSSGILHTIFEVGLEIDPILGLPYYPASTLKGAARAACTLTLSGGQEGDIKEDYSRACDLLFGRAGGFGVGHASLIVYSDAYPVGCLGGPCTIYMGDVITPHYYKGGETVEAEYEATPNPVVHLSIADGTVFSTVVASREAIDTREAEEAREKIQEWIARNRGRQEAGVLENALNASREHGLALVGAVFLVSAISSGLAARSGKGYNIGAPIPPEHVEKAHEAFLAEVRVVRVTTV